MTLLRLRFWQSDKKAGASERVTKKLSLIHTRTLKLTDEVLCVKHSPNGKYIAVGQSIPEFCV